MADLTAELLRAERGWVNLLTEAVLVIPADPKDPNSVDRALQLPAMVTILPVADLEKLWTDRADWRAYALEMERRGLWRRRAKTASGHD